MEKGILVFTHGDFAKALVQSLELIMGPQDQVKTLGLHLADDIEVLKKEAQMMIEDFHSHGQNVIVLTDLFGGSPANISLSLLKDYDIEVFTGVNMPMLIEAINFNSMENESLYELMKETAKSSIQSYNQKMFSKECA